MAKVVKFDGKKIGTGTEYTLIDSGQNIKKMANAYKELNKSVEDTDDGLEGAIDESPRLAEIIAKAVCELLNLNTAQKKRVMDLEFSFSDEYAFFNDCLSQFLGLEMPSIEDEPQEEEDPKLPEAE